MQEIDATRLTIYSLWSTNALQISLRRNLNGLCEPSAPMGDQCLRFANQISFNLPLAERIRHSQDEAFRIVSLTFSFTVRLEYAYLLHYNLQFFVEEKSRIQYITMITFMCQSRPRSVSYPIMVTLSRVSVGDVICVSCALVSPRLIRQISCYILTEMRKTRQKLMENGQNFISVTESAMNRAAFGFKRLPASFETEDHLYQPPHTLPLYALTAFPLVSEALVLAPLWLSPFRANSKNRLSIKLAHLLPPPTNRCTNLYPFSVRNTL